MKQRIIFLLLLMVLAIACGVPYKRMEKNYERRDQINTPDYSDLHYWAAHPFKKDPADSVPKPLRANYQQDSSVDVFFIHPTTYTDDQLPFGYNAPINNIELNTKTDYTTILFQASIFNEVGRVFAPRYRQANLQAYFPKNATDSGAAIAAFELAYQDVKAAFSYYLKNLHKGKPIIIAAHSQGTTHGKRLLKEFFDDQALQNKLVAAYLIGIPVAEAEFTKIKACTTPNQTGCIVSWRTYKEGYTPPLILEEKFKAIVTNPLTWTNEEIFADRQLNKGGVLLKFNKIVPSVASAKIEGNVLWTPKPKFFGNIFYTTNNYHVADINLYYLNIQENLRNRVSSYLKK
ncbi:MAG: hypothetical protein B7Z27_00075 [Sphingobacteriia bacterium 32-37-4]|nr:MAG: hypothetical protein B7Z27_00075 [Sphingobacteriia bacterium 32-37-4]